MSQMTVKVEFLAGTDIKDALREAKQKAILWQVCFVEFSFNDVEFSVSPNADLHEMEERWNAIRSGTPKINFVVG